MYVYLHTKGTSDAHSYQSSEHHKHSTLRKRQRTSIILTNCPRNKSIIQYFGTGAFDIEQQKECECGARVAKYMGDLTHNYRQMGEKESISYMIGRSLKWEKEKGVNELAGCRNRIKKKIEGEKQNLNQEQNNRHR